MQYRILWVLDTLTWHPGEAYIETGGANCPRSSILAFWTAPGVRFIQCFHSRVKQKEETGRKWENRREIVKELGSRLGEIWCTGHIIK